MKDRIIKFLAHENLSATKFADEIGVQRSSVSHILSGRNNPSYEFIFKILSRYKYLSAEWLIMGSGQMIKKSEEPSANAMLAPSNSHVLDLFQQSPDKSSSQEASGKTKSESISPKSASRKIDKIL